MILPRTIAALCLFALLTGACHDRCTRETQSWIEGLEKTPSQTEPSRIKRLYAHGVFFHEFRGGGPLLALDNHGVYTTGNTFGFSDPNLINWLSSQQESASEKIIELDVDHDTLWLRLVQVLSAARQAGWRKVAFRYDTDPWRYPHGPPRGTLQNELRKITELSPLPALALSSSCPEKTEAFLALKTADELKKIFQEPLLSCLCRMEVPVRQMLLWYLHRPRPPALVVELAENKEDAVVVELPEILPWKATFSKVQSAAYSQKKIYFAVLWANPQQPTLPLQTPPPQDTR